MPPWRLVIDSGMSGARQMAVDAAVLQARAENAVPATLRLYRFSPRCVTLGRFQDTEDIDRDWCRTHGVDLARRPTGGRGVLHDDELTYAIVAGVSDGVPRGVAASYRYLCSGLVGAYRELGMEAVLTARERGDGSSGACYLHATNADLSVGAAKLSGSAQVWREDVCLQHGSFVRSRDLEAESCAFGLTEEETARLRGETLSIRDALGRDVSDDELRAVITSGMSRALGIEFEEDDLSQGERDQVESLVQTFEIP